MSAGGLGMGKRGWGGGGPGAPCRPLCPWPYCLALADTTVMSLLGDSAAAERRAEEGRGDGLGGWVGAAVAAVPPRHVPPLPAAGPRGPDSP